MKRAAKNVQKSSKMWIDGKSFEILPFNNKKDELLNKETTTSVNYDIKENEEGKLCTSFQLPPFYYSKLATFPNFDMSQLESSTETKILLPILGKLVISGENKEKIALARDEIHSVICEIRNKSTPIQFISIPTISDEIKENFRKFKQDVLNDNIKDVEDSIFQSADKLHLTINVLSLQDEREIAAVTNALKTFKQTILDPMLENSNTNKIRVCGIDCMNNHYKKSNVIYANVKLEEETENLSLQNVADKILDYFYENGFCKEYHSSVKLHMTLINTKYRKQTNGVKNKRWVKKIPIDATTIMEKYKNYDFGTCDFRAISLNLISTVGPDGFYKTITSIEV